MADRLTEIEALREQLFTGGYDATEGQPGSRDTTWTDFGIAIGRAEWALGRVRVLEAALRGVGWNDDGGMCWCPRSRDEDRRPHDSRCNAARAALARDEVSSSRQSSNHDDSPAEKEPDGTDL